MPTTAPAPGLATLTKFGTPTVAHTAASSHLTLHGKHALDYLTHRGLTVDALHRWNIGLWAPEVRALLLDHYGANETELDERSLDARLDHRITIPLTLPDGTPVALCGRTVPPDTTPPRWVYPKASTLVNPRSLLLGYHNIPNWPVDPTFSKHDPVVQLPLLTIPVVEGPFDTILCQEAGIPAVGLCGLGLTLEKALLLRALNRPITLLPDGDEGHDIMLRNAQRWLKDLPGLRIATLPPGTDPAQLVTDDRAQEILDAILNAEPVPPPTR